MHFNQHQVFPAAPAIPTIDPRFIHPSAMLQPYQQVMPLHQMVSYGQPATLTNPLIYEASTAVQPWHFQNYQQAVGHQSQIYNSTYSQTPAMHFNVPTSKLKRHQGNPEVVEVNASGCNLAHPMALQPSFHRPLQDQPQTGDQVLWKPPFYEPHRVPECLSTSSPLVEDDNDSVPPSTNTSDLSTSREVRTIETPEPPMHTEAKLSHLQKKVKKTENYHDRENEDERVSHDAISFSSDGNITAAIMSKKSSCDDHEALCESSSENSRAVDYSLPTSGDITSEGRSTIALEPAPLVYSIAAKGTRNRKSFGLDDVSCSQVSAASITPRSL